MCPTAKLAKKPKQLFEKINADRLAYWYLRLNGFFTISNFVVHPDPGTDGNQRTDIDVFGIRFPYRNELLYNSMQDDEKTMLSTKVPVIVVAEVAVSRCKLNGPWTEPNKENMQRVLRAIGTFHDKAQKKVAEQLYTQGRFENRKYLILLVCFGGELDAQLRTKRPDVPQILWTHVKEFIHQRFAQYEQEKASHAQWDEDGHKLWNLFMKTKWSPEAFTEALRVV